jgi:2-oxoglutarate dehydrogenase E2 component (dihydrolipoamide succinyltransferase)
VATDTAVDVVMPQMGVSVSEGTVTKWLKQEGDSVAADEPLLEISTDKVDTEVPSPGSGVLSQILVQEGETVEVGAKLAVIAPEGAAAAAPPEAPPEPATQEAAREVAAAAPVETVQPVQPEPEAAPEPEPAPEPVTAAAEVEAPPAGNGKAFVSPVVARIAAEHGVDVSRISGTGTGGRVTKKDILGFIDSGAAAEPEAPPAPPTPAPTAEAPPAPPPAEPAPAPAAAAPAPPKPAAPPPAPAPAPAEEGESFEPVTPMRRGIAEHMRRSLDTSAHVTSAIEVDM